MLWLKYAVLFLTTFTATTSCVFKFWHLTTCPKVPWPSTSRIRYRFLNSMLAVIVTVISDLLTLTRTYDQSPLTRECHLHIVCSHYPRYQTHHSLLPCLVLWALSEGSVMIRIWSLDCKFYMLTASGLWELGEASLLVSFVTELWIPSGLHL